ncbi:hypothetical protein [Pinirhizobacter soli]|nr:hypothetical protein [Pinirhizobacter soli]
MQGRHVSVLMATAAGLLGLASLSGCSAPQMVTSHKAEGDMLTLSRRR